MSAAERASRIGPATRPAALERLRGEPLDVLVVGGGITGAGVALDAATRGLDVALVEKRDFGAGTSSRSSKLIHGGLRYLEQGDFSLVREALHERALLLGSLAPHLVEPIPFLFPLRHRVWERAYIGAGIGVYDALGGRNPAVPRHRHLSRTAALAKAPALRPEALVGAVLYHDARTEDERYVIALLRTAVAHGAHAAAGVRLEALESSRDGLRQVTLFDTESGSRLRARARVVINATGVWGGDVERLAGVESPLAVRASKGVHLLVPRDRIDSAVALTVRTSRSVLFVIPWGEHWLIGTTDTEWRLGRDHPVASQADIRYLVENVNGVLREPIGEEDVVGVYAGLRPLIGDDGDTVALSREYVVRRPAPGLVTVAGGKFTTYRLMARDAVDAAAAEMGERIDPSRTDRLPLLGAEGLVTATGRAHEHPGARRLPAGAVDRLLGRYGSSALVLLDALTERPELAQPLQSGSSYLRAEAWYGVVAEGALYLDDLLTRRTRLSIEASDRGRGAAAPAARLMGELLGWSRRRLRGEVAHYLARLDAEARAAAAPDDARADAARSVVRDTRLAKEQERFMALEG